MPRLPVVIATAIVGGAMAFLFVWFVLSLLFRWRFQFRIRSMLLLAVIAVPCGWLKFDVEQSSKQAEAVQAVEAVGAAAFVRGSTLISMKKAITQRWRTGTPGPVWLRQLLGETFFADAESAFAVEDVESVLAMPHLRSLGLHGKKINDAALRHLDRLKYLQRIDLIDTAITDAGLEQPRDFPSLSG